jgi:hypothetical protein
VVGFTAAIRCAVFAVVALSPLYGNPPLPSWYE